MLTLNRFPILLGCSPCWLWTSKCQLGTLYSLTYMLKKINISEPIKKWRPYDFYRKRTRIVFNQRHIMRVMYQFVITAALLRTITQTEEINNALKKQFFHRCRSWNSIFRDNSGEHSVNACIGGEKKKLYEIGMGTEQPLIHFCFG